MDTHHKSASRQAHEALREFSAMQMFVELGYIIAIPIVMFGIGGAYADKYLGTTPMIMLSGFMLAIAMSCMGVWKIVKRTIIDDGPAQTGHAPEQKPEEKAGL